ncbi:four helix bundle protein [Mucilaginibacter terrae]|uniref:Four helix bundle protein n=1 Tax=Mucilaginibacter terrae TaxID=1955052 RepID=A0ABU3GXF3_9SPHI|nr:four helix bundle protein [Mucilaginibacter terrae]MDT3404136.1 four helix bundle protein [Mucilaginibacter terrae]
MHNFRELKVWQAGIQICKSIYQVAHIFPATERYGLTSQITRSAVSIPSNIAEGCGRKSGKEFQHFLSIALGSAYELETQIIIANELSYIPDEQLKQLTIQITEIQKMLSGLRNTLST